MGVNDQQCMHAHMKTPLDCTSTHTVIHPVAGAPIGAPAGRRNHCHCSSLSDPFSPPNAFPDARPGTHIHINITRTHTAHRHALACTRTHITIDILPASPLSQSRTSRTQSFAHKGCDANTMHYRGNAKLSTLFRRQVCALRGIQVGRIIWHCRLLLRLHGPRHERLLRLLRLHGHELRLRLLRLRRHELRLPWRARERACAQRV